MPVGGGRWVAWRFDGVQLRRINNAFFMACAIMGAAATTEQRRTEQKIR